MRSNKPIHKSLKFLTKFLLIVARTVVLLPAYYCAYVAGYFLVILVLEPSALIAFDDYHQAFNVMPKMVLILSFFCLGIPFVSELSGLLYIYTGKKKYFIWAVLFVAWKTFLLLLVAFVGGKNV